MEKCPYSLILIDAKNSNNTNYGLGFVLLGHFAITTGIPTRKNRKASEIKLINEIE